MANEIVSGQSELLQLVPEEARDFLRQLMETALRRVMEEEVSGLVGARVGEQSEDRTTYRNGYRDRRYDSRVGSLLLQVPKLRPGSYFPSFLEPRRRSERALLSVV